MVISGEMERGVENLELCSPLVIYHLASNA